MKTSYFGCWLEAGHYPFDVHFNRIPRTTWQGHWLCARDAKLTPRREVRGLGLIHYFDGFCVLAFWGTLIDERPGSNSMFLIETDQRLTFTEALEHAKQEFPKVFAHLKFKIVNALI